MRVLFVTQYYPPETGAAPLRAYHFARTLAEDGHSVTVVTGMPNHPSGVKPRAYRWKLAAREKADGVRIRRCYTYATPHKTFATRMLNQLSFTLTGLLGGLATGPCDTVLVTSPPLFLGLTGWLLALFKGVPFVLDVRDYWPRAAVALGQLRGRRAIARAEGLERFLYRRASRIVAVTPSTVRMMVESGVPEHRVVLIPNGADTRRFTPGAQPAGRGDGHTVLYSGTHGLIHGMEALLDAAAHLRSDASVRFLLVGDGAEKDALVRRAASMGLSNVEFRPSQQPEDLARTIRGASVCVATMSEGQFSDTAVPVKMFDYMACARPVVAAVAGDARDIVEASRGGVVVPPGDGKGLAEAVRRLVGDPALADRLGLAGHEFVSRHYSRAALAARMEAMLRETVVADRWFGRGRLRFRRYLAAKYTLDWIFAAAALVLASPLFAAVAAAIALDTPGPVIFTQRRIGVHSHEFTIRKFRTMRRDTPHIATDLMAETPMDYTTRMGRLLRRFSLDELPNLVNVIRGDMSVVGPRPALYNQHELIAMRRRGACDLMRPGLTGWAQINGRNLISLDEKVRLDEFYVRHCSIVTDARIILRTLVVMFRKEDLPSR
jgi:lipopolysaccharide/colanic/teichoic acid biosynthesis glycosyltransferase/glycosyltransferase involved in cell wall biosynthesis